MHTTTTKSILAHCLCFSLVSTVALADKSQHEQIEIKGINLASPDFKKLFDGKTLDGWEILPGGQWKADNGVIVGQQDKTEKRHGMLLFRMSDHWQRAPPPSTRWITPPRKSAHLELDLGGERTSIPALTTTNQFPHRPMNPMITRRNFMKAGSTVAVGSALSPHLVRAAETDESRRPVLPTPGQQAWQDGEVGVIFHFDLAVAAGETTDNNAARKTWDPTLYQPDKLNTDEWLTAAKAAGAGYAIFTATHFNGFMQWQSDLYPYGLKQTTWRDGKGDVVGDFVASCRRVGIKPGLYFSVHRNVYQKVWGHYVDWGKGRGTPAQEKFNRVAEKQMEELCSRYGPLVQIWFDAGTKTPAEGGPDMLPIFRRHQPQSVFYHSMDCGEHRWIGNEAGYADDPCWATMPDHGQTLLHAGNAAGRKLLGTGDPNGTTWSPGMVDVPLRGANKIHNWFWAPNEDRAVQSTDTLVKMYDQSVGRNCNFVIGAVIKPDGTLPAADAMRLAQFGAEIKRRYGKPVAETKGDGEVLELHLSAPTQLNAVIVMEDIARGERVREYIIDGRAHGGEWVKLAAGQSIGHKRIQSFARRELAVVRLRLTKSIAPPAIRRLAVFDTGPRITE